jgi:hypothetical protein
MTTLTATSLTLVYPFTLRTLLIIKAELNSFITVSVNRPNLQNMTRPCLNHCDRDSIALLIINLRHTDLTA